MTTFRNCDTCDRPMRHPRQRAADHPGTTVLQTSTTCSPCSRRTKNEENKQALVHPCPKCGRPTHPARNVTDRPEGTLRRAPNGLCGGCYSSHLRGTEPRPQPNLEESAYIRARRRRGVPAEGKRAGS